MVTVKFADVLAAFQFVSGGALSGHQAFIDLDTGALYCISEDIEPDEPVPEDLEA
ncbi:hypothetical protein AAFF27_07465 [Xylophilus sp. GW821-FHT01B05]